MAAPLANQAAAEPQEVITSDGISLLSIDYRNQSYRVQVYALPMDSSGNVVGQPTQLPTQTMYYNDQITVIDLFTGVTGQYQSAYIGTATEPATDDGTTLDDIVSIRVSRTGYSGNRSYHFR